MKIEIIKCHGSGNDFAMVDARAIALTDAEWAGAARALADRAGPVGGDGLLLLTTPPDHHFGFGFRMMNSDGSEAETCLNGLRCVARLGFERLGLTRAEVKLKTARAQVARAPALADGIYTVTETAGPAELDASRWLKDGGHERVERTIPGLPSDRAFTAVAMPNPHLVAFVDAVDEAELTALWRFAEAAPPLLPERANVSFVASRSHDTLFVRTAERGVGLTDSCGSAMAAATYAAALTGRVGFGGEVVVLNKGGRVQARADADGMISIQGNATFEWEGEVEVDLASERAGDLRIARHFNDEIAAWARVAGCGGAGGALGHALINCWRLGRVGDSSFWKGVWDEPPSL